MKTRVIIKVWQTFEQLFPGILSQYTNMTLKSVARNPKIIGSEPTAYKGLQMAPKIFDPIQTML
jgi:hypothetical protein